MSRKHLQTSPPWDPTGPECPSRNAPFLFKSALIVKPTAPRITSPTPQCEHSANSCLARLSPPFSNVNKLLKLPRICTHNSAFDPSHSGFVYTFPRIWVIVALRISQDSEKYGGRILLETLNTQNIWVILRQLERFLLMLQVSKYKLPCRQKMLGFASVPYEHGFSQAQWTVGCDS